MSRPSLQDVAKEANVSKMTASRVLRNQSKVAPGTREAVLAAAKKLGYTPDTQVIRLMQHLKTFRTRKFIEPVALVWPDASRREVATNPYLKQILRGAECRATELGFAIEQFYLAEGEMTMGRLDKILYARGIEGVIIGLLSHHAHMEITLSWERLCAVKICEGQLVPPFHQVGHSQYDGMALALKELAALGWRRIGLHLDPIVAERLDHVYEASFLLHHPLPLAEAAPLMLLKERLTPSEFNAWVEMNGPEIVLSLECPMLRDWLAATRPRAKRKPELVTLNYIPEKPESDFAGINQNFSQLASNAVDLVTASMLRSDHGIPAFPKLLLSRGFWVPRKKAPRKKSQP